MIKESISHNGKFDSFEEKHFNDWCTPLTKAGYIREVFHEPISFVLSEPIVTSFLQEMKTKTKIVDKFRSHGHVYTPDFLIIWDASAHGIFFDWYAASEDLIPSYKDIPFLAQKSEESGDIYTFVEIKPSFDQNNMTRLATLNCKWTMEKLGEFVQIVVPVPDAKGKPKNALFQKTFIPNNFLFTNKSGKPRKINFKFKTFDEFIKPFTRQAKLEL